MKKGPLVNITIKCSHCFRQIPQGNRFCIYCGKPLFLADRIAQQKTDAVQPSSPATESYVPTHRSADNPVHRTVASSSTESSEVKRYCPNGHDVADPSLGFCVQCGFPLVDKPASSGR